MKPLRPTFNFLDLFAGAGGLSEGFVQAGFESVAHVEADAAACATLKTRQVFHWLKQQNNIQPYVDYLNGQISRNDFWSVAPKSILDSVINEFIEPKTLDSIFEKVDKNLDGKELDLIVGGPPCQAYSLIGRARGNMKDDPRNHLYIQYAEFLKRYQPKYFVFENVLGLLSARDPDGELYFDKMKKLFKEIGYSIEYKTLNAVEFGVLQNRKRIILIGKRGQYHENFYPEFINDIGYATVKDALTDLPKIQAGEGSHLPCEISKNQSKWLKLANISTKFPVTWHQSRPNTKQDLEIYKSVVQVWNEHKKRLNYNDLPERLKSHRVTTSFTDRFKIVAADLPASHTVVAHMSKDGHHYIHPDIEQNRSLTPREAARLQTFPDDYYFESQSGKPSRTSAYKQIGNAVPVLLARVIAEAIKDNLKND
ncbi:DNA cytosine methyltransferase [Acinetobacter sp. CWB-B33]|uniref:DNA cytosine methyltransferase n=1 Tax=Acinetobacter sp. CWB-B33 TaxID=2815724 RepID=UPI0031FF3A3E